MFVWDSAMDSETGILIWDIDMDSEKGILM